MTNVITVEEEKRLDQAAEGLLDEESVYELHATPLVSAQQLRAQHKERIKNYLRDNELKRSIGRGFDLIRQDIIEVLTKEQLEPFFAELGKINPRALDNPSPKVQKLLAEKSATLTFQDVFELSNEILKQIYTLGYQYFQRKEYEHAIDIFAIVTTLNPFVTEFWNAMALCFQAKQEWTKALDTFAIACTLNENDVSSRISRAYCCLSMQQNEEAMEELALAKEIIDKNPALDNEWGEYLKKLKAQV